MSNDSGLLAYIDERASNRSPIGPHLTMLHDAPEQCKVCAFYYDSGNFCAKLNLSELHDLHDHSQLETIKRGTQIWDHVLDDWPILAIESGVMSLQQILSDGRKTIASFFMRGDIIDLRNAANRKLGALVALSEVTVCRLSPEKFERIVNANEDARVLIWENLRDQTFRAIAHSSDLAKKSSREKLAAFIFECQRRSPSSHRCDVVEIPVRRRDLAEYLGMQPETISRCFKDFEKRGIIGVSDLSTIRILDAPALRQIANGARPEEARRSSGHNAYNILTTSA